MWTFLFFVMFFEIHPEPWVYRTNRSLLWAAFALTCVSAVHYIILVGQRLKAQNEARMAVTAK